MSVIQKVFLQNEQVVRRLFRKYFRQAEEVEDLAQETFLKCFVAEKQIEIQDPRAFLLRVAKNLALTEVRKKARTNTNYLDDLGGSDALADSQQPSAAECLDGKRKLRALDEAISNLSAEVRKTLIMRKIDGMKIVDIAQVLDVSESTVHKRLAAALVLCEKHLRDRGYDPIEFGAESPHVKYPKPTRPASIVSLPGAAARCKSDNDEQIQKNNSFTGSQGNRRKGG